AKAVLLVAELRRRDLWRLHVRFANAGADVAGLAAHLSGGSLVWTLTLHGPAEFFDVTQNRLGAKLDDALWVACVSDWVRSQAMSLMPAEHWDRLRVVRLGVDTDEWSPGKRSVADVFCLPSFRESLPVVLMEALAMEVPVVATRIMGVPELVEEDVSGLLVSPGRADELATALGRLATEPELRERFGRAGRARVQ